MTSVLYECMDSGPVGCVPPESLQVVCSENDGDNDVTIIALAIGIDRTQTCCSDDLQIIESSEHYTFEAHIRCPCININL